MEEKLKVGIIFKTYKFIIPIEECGINGKLNSYGDLHFGCDKFTEYDEFEMKMI